MGSLGSEVLCLSPWPRLAHVHGDAVFQGGAGEQFGQVAVGGELGAGVGVGGEASDRVDDRRLIHRHPVDRELGLGGTVRQMLALEPGQLGWRTGGDDGGLQEMIGVGGDVLDGVPWDEDRGAEMAVEESVGAEEHPPTPWALEQENQSEHCQEREYVEGHGLYCPIACCVERRCGKRSPEMRDDADRGKSEKHEYEGDPVLVAEQRPDDTASVVVDRDRVRSPIRQPALRVRRP